MHKGVEHFLEDTHSEEANNQGRNSRDDSASDLAENNAVLEDHFNNLNEQLRQELNVNLGRMLKALTKEKKKEKK